MEFIEVEEAYSSQASFLDRDELPSYGEKPDGWRPSGKRVKRGLYQTAKGWLVNAEANAAANLSDHFGSRIEVNQPCNLSLQVRLLSMACATCGTAADSGVQNDSFDFFWRFDVAVEVIPSRPTRWRTYCLDPTFLLPSPQSVETHPKIIRRFSRFYIPSHTKQPY